MKHKKSLKETLGIPQEELAALLGVNRSQLSMYESGKRELPLTAMIELTSMLTYMEKSKRNDKLFKEYQENEKQLTLKQLEKELQETVYLQLLLEKRMNVMQKIRNENLNALQLLDYLETKIPEKNNILHQHIKNKALLQLKKNSDYQLERLGIKKMILELQSKTLKQKIKTINNDKPNDLV